MKLSLRGTVVDNRGILWTVAITFALAAIVFPLVLLAAFGHFFILQPYSTGAYVIV